jgi:hypothetical protein
MSAPPRMGHHEQSGRRWPSPLALCAGNFRRPNVCWFKLRWLNVRRPDGVLHRHDLGGGAVSRQQGYALAWSPVGRRTSPHPIRADRSRTRHRCLQSRATALGRPARAEAVIPRSQTRGGSGVMPARSLRAA